MTDKIQFIRFYTKPWYKEFILLLVLMISCSVFGQSYEEKLEIDSLKKVIRTAKNDTTLIEALMNLDKIVYYYDPDLDFKLSAQIDSIADINLGKKLNKKNRYFFLNSKAFAQNSLGNIYLNDGKYTLAMESYMEALDMYRKLEHKDGISSVSTNIGNIHFTLENFDKALEFYNKSLQIDTELKNQYGIATCLNNMALVYTEFEEYEKAEDYYLKSLKIARKIDNKIEESNCLNNLGLNYFNKKEYLKSIEYYKMSLAIVRKLDYLYSAAGCLNNIGSSYIALNDMKNALKSSEEGYDLSIKVDDKLLIRAAAENLYQINKKLGNLKIAMEMLELVNSIQENLDKEKQNKQLAQQEYQFKLAQRATADSIINSEALKVKNAEIAKNRAETESQKQRMHYLYLGLALVALFSLFMFNRYKVISKQKNTIAEQKNLVEQQKAAVEKQKAKIEIQHQQLEETHNEISDSIKYAERLQLAMLPSSDELNAKLNDGFVLYIPKNTVSGDFYWLHESGDTIYFAVADCTGHGVPGAMVSVVCFNALNRSVNEFGIKAPKDILNKTRELVIETFANNGTNVKDGMDIALCALNGDNLSFSGANNPIWIVRNNDFLTDTQRTDKSTMFGKEKSLIEYKSNKQPIGTFEDMKDFDQVELKLSKGDRIYLFSDGLADQFGGPKGKKFMYRPFKEHLLSISDHSMMDQQKATNNIFQNWKGTEEQVDDVCVLGVKF